MTNALAFHSKTLLMVKKVCNVGVRTEKDVNFTHWCDDSPRDNFIKLFFSLMMLLENKQKCLSQATILRLT